MNTAGILEPKQETQLPDAVPTTGIRVILIRPGATILDDQGRIRGDLDLPLCPAGVAQVEDLKRQFDRVPFQAIFTAPCTSAIQTAEALAHSQRLRVRIDPDLRNLNHGLWQGRCIDELRLTQPKVYRRWADDPGSVAPPAGETLASATRRADRFVQRVIAKFDAANIVVIVSEPMTSIVRSSFTHAELSDFWDAERRTSGWETIRIDVA